MYNLHTLGYFLDEEHDHIDIKHKMEAPCRTITHVAPNIDSDSKGMLFDSNCMRLK